MLARAISCALIIVWASSPFAQLADKSQAAAGRVERGIGLHDGRSIAFDVIDGWAVVEGDIVIGRAGELSRALNERAADIRPRTLTIGYQGNLWSRAASGIVEIPYTIAADANGKVPPAIASFNATFAGFMQFVPRAAQADYVEFALNLPDSAPACTSPLGRVGGRQMILGPPSCSTGTVLHEMGHAIGLQHEQNREDRDLYLAWQPQNVAKTERVNSALKTFNRKAVGPYDYGSIMHYGDFDFSANGQPAYATLPQGIEIGQRRSYSAADVDTVRRLYGAAPTSVTVTSAPPGLTVFVDGSAVTTPATFAWPIGSAHTIDVAAAPQALGPATFVFGRWNTDLVGDNSAARSIRVDPGTGAAGMPAASPAVTVYTANFVRMYPFSLSIGGDTAAARAATTASVSPEPQAVSGLPGAYFRSRQLVTLTAITTGSTTFGGWIGTNYARVNVGQSSPTVTAYPTETSASVAGWDVQAYASQAPALRVRGVGDDGTADGLLLTVDGVSVRSPTSTALSFFDGPGARQVLAVSPQYRAAATTRYTFKDWDGSPANPTSVPRPQAGQPSRDITANFAAQHLVTTDQASACTGTVSIAGATADGYYDHGQTLALTATPSAGWKFIGWSDDLTGSATSQSIAVNGEVYVTASYNLTTEPFAVTGISRLFAVAGDAPFNVMLYGTGFTPTTTAFVAGFSRAATVIDSNHIRVPLTAADLATAGELRISAGNTDAAGTCRILSASGLAVQERGYAWPATTPVVEFYNAALDHYFVTANPDEMAKLDDGTFKGWARTQQSFKAFPADSPALPGALARAVCRFYGNPDAGLDSHFYSASKEECDDVKRKFPTAWVFESPIVFQSVVPDRTTGQCPDGTVAVYRLFNQRADANHRYTTDTAIRSQMIAKNYVPEGYGPLGVALCALA